MTASDVDIRRAIPSDASDIAQLVTALGYPSAPEQMQSRLEAMARDDRYAVFVALADGRTVGMVAAVIQHVFEQDWPIGRIIALSVDTDFQGMGLGKSMVKTAERWIGSQGATSVLVNSGYDRNDAHRFYARIGYAAKGTSFRKTL